MVNDKKLLIAGIDNGATKSYALLDLDGQLIRINSSKKFTLASITKEISGEGTVVKLFNSAGHSAPLATVKHGNEIFYIPAFKGAVEGEKINFGKI